MVRIKVNRRTEGESITVEKAMKAAKSRGKYKIFYKDKSGEEIEATLEVKFEEVGVKLVGN